MFLNFGTLFFKMFIFEVVETFFLAQWLSSQLSFQINVFEEEFFLFSLSEYQTFEDGDMLRGALTHKLA